MLSQPEYLLVSGYDTPSIAEGATAPSVVDSARGKLVIVQLFGGYDWLHGMIPKSDYDAFVDLRTTESNGTIATDRANLIEIGDYYMSDVFSAFAPFAPTGNLKVFNGVGGSWHSRDHDAAQRQMSSFSDTTDVYDEGIVGHLIRTERDSANAISLGAGSPNVYRGGNYIAIGSNGAQIRNADGGIQTADRERYLSVLRGLAASRQYPADSGGVFRAAAKIDEVATASKSRGGRDGAGYNLADRLAFLKDLMDSDV